MSHVQEVFVHTFPLLVLIMQNGESEKVDFGLLGNFTIFLAILSMSLTALEVCILQCYENQHINLEMRVKLRSGSRLTDLFKATGLGIILTSMALLLGIFAFDRQGCITDFFEENSICKPCRDFVNPFCSQCDDRFACNECDKGYYAFDKSCIDCTLRD